MSGSENRQSAQRLAPVLAAMREQSRVPRSERLKILRSDGVDALGSAVFGDTLWDPVRDEAVNQAEKDLGEWLRRGYRSTGLLDPAYPIWLYDMVDAPPIIYSVGELIAKDVGVSVIGSRNASPVDIKDAAEVGRELVHHGLTVVSGLAAGVDTAAHSAALGIGGRTVAVMGTGLAHTYPVQNRELRLRIEGSGLVISQFEPPQSGTKWSFPLRNAVMSGYSVATVIVVAGEHSGTRYQAQAAVDQGRVLVLTPAVASQTSWGRQYVADGLAVVANNPSEVAELVLSTAKNVVNCANKKSW